MSEFNQDIAKRNINELLRNKGMTQQQFAGVLGMSQSNVSKALSVKEKKFFTVEQIYSIANHFAVSIDWILGYKTSDRKARAPRAIGAFLAELLKSKEAKVIPIKVSETVYEIDFDSRNYEQNCEVSNPENTYLSIYFPNYWDPDEFGKTEEEKHESFNEAYQCGNSTRNGPLNNFLWKYVEILKHFNEDQMSEELYQNILKEYLSKLREY